MTSRIWLSDAKAAQALTSAAIRGDTAALRRCLDRLAGFPEVGATVDEVLVRFIEATFVAASTRYGGAPEALGVDHDALRQLSLDQLEGVAHRVAMLAFGRPPESRRVS